MDLQLAGKNAVILGGTRGIGRAIAETLAAEGANVAVCARNADQVAEAVAALAKSGVKATGKSGAMAQGADPASWEQNFKLDVLGMVNAFDAARPFLLKAATANGDASFVIIASVSAAEADNGSSYGPIKAALIHFAKGLARQYAGKHLRTNVVSPGTVYFAGGVWEMVEKNLPEMFKGAMERNPMGRMATPQDVANAAVFLASPVSSFTTGVNLLVDGAISRRVNF
jgi:3-oxoacyl-[acyl-carrier protein] reductase